MGLFDIFTESGRTFIWLYDNHFEATELAYRAKKGSPWDRMSSDKLTRAIPNEDKAWLAEQKNAILEIDRILKVENQKPEIIKAGKKYKRAFLHFCMKAGVKPSFFFSMGDRPSMPGEQVFRSFRPLYNVRLSYPMDTISVQDKHFQTLVTEALSKYGYKPKLAYIITLDESLNDLLYALKTTPPLQEELLGSPKPRLPYGISIRWDNKLSVEFPQEQKDISAVYQHLTEFEKAEKGLSILVERERLWKQFEDRVLADQYGQRYYREFFKAKYGTELVSLDEYEALVKHYDSFYAYIKRQEADYDSLKIKYRFGLAEFEKRNPEIPHNEYFKHSSAIALFERRSMSFLFSSRQTELSGKLAAAVSGQPGWGVFLKEIDVKCDDYDGNRFTSQTTRAFIHRYLSYGDKYSMTEYERFYEIDKSKFSFCTDIFENTIATKNLTQRDTNAILNELNSVLSRVIPAYLDICRHLRIVIAGDLWDYLGDQSLAKYRICRLPALEEYSSCIDTIINDEFDENDAGVPHLFLALETSTDVFDPAVPNHILSSIISISLGIDYEELTEIENKREKEHREEQLAQVRNLKRKYPYGFRTYCVNRFGTEDESRLKIDLVLANEDEIRRLQLKEDELLREDKRKSEERWIICKAIRIVRRYSSSFSELFPGIGEVDTLAIAERIVAAENRIIEFDSICCRKAELFEHQRLVCGLPHKYFYDYYSKKRFGDDVTKEAASHRSLIWLFKDGRVQHKIATQVADFLKASRIASFGDRITFACIPASDHYTNESRFRLFSEEVCNALGFRDAFEHIKVCSSVTPRRLGGKRMAELEIDNGFFKDAFVLLFDDVVTSGTTASHLKDLLEAAGAHCIGIISLGKTV